MRAPLLALVAILNCVSARADDAISFHGSVATLITDTPLGFAMIEARARITSHITGSAAFAHLDPSGPHEEQQLRLSLSAAFAGEGYSFDDRFLWARSDTEVEYWRNRWRLFLPIGNRFGNARWLLFDELYYSDPRGFFRNIAAAGVSFNPMPRLTSDIVYTYIDNRHSEVDHGLLVMLSMRFN